MSAETRARILSAAETLGYSPNAIAQGLITRRSNMVAIVISNLMNLHYPEVLTQLTARLSDRGMRVLLFTLASDEETDTVLDQIWRYQVDGAIVVAPLLPHHVGAFAGARVPFVLYNREVKGCRVASVLCDNAAGEGVLVDALLSGGARRFGFIAGPETSTVGEARRLGALERLASVEIVDVPVERGDFSYSSGHAAAMRMLDHRTFDAIIAANDSMAMGAMDAARFEHGLCIPADLSVVGFDGIGPAAWGSFRLTTMRQPIEDMADAAVAMVLERVERSSLPVEQRIFRCAFVRGASARVGPA